jgi:hypothetical protein
VLLAVAAIVTIVWLAIVLLWRDAPFAMTFDDAFYYFGIARNVAHGHGSTFDGIDPTNGYHPLWMLVAVPLFAAGADGTSAVRALLVVQVLCYGAALAGLALIAARAIDGWPRLRVAKREDRDRAAQWCTAIVALALGVAALNPFIVKVFVNGMESGILVALDAAVLVIGSRWRGRLLRGGRPLTRWVMGAVLALTVLARTDAVLLLGVMGLWFVAEAVTDSATSWRSAIRPWVELFALPAVTLVGYLISNQVMFGLLVQISGLTKRTSLNATRAGWMAVAVVVAALVGLWGFRRTRRTGPHRRSRFGRVRHFTASTAWFAAFCILVVAYYQVLQSQQWLWYYCPVVLYLMALLVVGVADFAEAAVLEAPRKTAGAALAPVSAILLLPLVVGLLVETRQISDRSSYSLALADRDAGEWIDHHVPAGTVMASWDAGALGYYSHRPVINLDGVANSYAYYQASRAGTVGQFLRARHLAGVVNVGTPVEGEDPQITGFVGYTLGPDAEARLRRVQAWPFRYSGTTTGAAGTASGTRDLAIFLYELSGGQPSPSN